MGVVPSFSLKLAMEVLMVWGPTSDMNLQLHSIELECPKDVKDLDPTTVAKRSQDLLKRTPAKS